MASDPTKLQFSSDFRYERVALKSSTTFSVASFGFSTLTIPHNLGYRPYFKAWYGFGDGKYFGLVSGPASFNIDGNSFQVDNIYADSTNLYVSLENDSGGTVSGRVYYRIYAEPQQ